MILKKIITLRHRSSEMRVNIETTTGDDNKIIYNNINKIYKIKFIIFYYVILNIFIT